MLTAVLAVCTFSSHAHALKGDANGDGVVNVHDSRLVADYLVGNVLSIPRPEDADVSGDGQTTTADALLILQFAKGLRTSFDFQAPLVLTVLPAVGSTNVLLTTNVSIFFSEPISPTSLSGSLTIRDVASGLPVPGRIERSQEGVIATFFPDQPLNPLTTYRVDVTTGVMDNEDNPLQQAFSGTFQTQALGTGILISTNNLSAPVGSLLPQPLVFKAVDASGSLVKQVPVTFKANMGSGFFEPSGLRQVTVLTNDNGLAQASFRLGKEAVVHTIDIGAVGFSAVPVYSASALPTAAVNLRIYSGNGQNGAPGGIAPLPLIVQASDEGGNSIAGTMVTFNITQGQGNFAGQPTATIPTDSSGTASVFFTFGPSPGVVQVQARFPDMRGQAPVFSMLDLLPQPSSPTVITGRVIDAQTLQPLSHIYVYVAETPSTWDWTDQNGAFRLPVTPGPHIVDVDGFESGIVGGQLYPVVAVPVNAVEGQENHISMPVILPRMEQDSYLDVSDTQGGTLTIRSNQTWQMYVAPGQVRFANGGRTGRLYVAAVSPDKIPMPVAGGKNSRFFDTVQPLNVVFDPPAQVSFPNTDNLPPGTITDIFTLSYTSGTFIRTGRARASEDGRVVTSLPGEGITQGGWHNAPDPDTQPTTCVEVVVDLGPGVESAVMTLFGQSAVGVLRPLSDFPVSGLPDLPSFVWEFQLCNVSANMTPFSPFFTWLGGPRAPPPAPDRPPFNQPPPKPKPNPPPPSPDPSPDSGKTKIISFNTIPLPHAVRAGESFTLTASITVETGSPEGLTIKFVARNPERIYLTNGGKATTNASGVATISGKVLHTASTETEEEVEVIIDDEINPNWLLSALVTALLIQSIEVRLEFEIDSTALFDMRSNVGNNPIIRGFLGLARDADEPNLWISPRVLQEYLDPVNKDTGEPILIGAAERADRDQMLTTFGIFKDSRVPRSDYVNRFFSVNSVVFSNPGDAEILASAAEHKRVLITADNASINVYEQNINRLPIMKFLYFPKNGSPPVIRP